MLKASIRILFNPFDLHLACAIHQKGLLGVVGGEAFEYTTIEISVTTVRKSVCVNGALVRYCHGDRRFQRESNTCVLSIDYRCRQ